MVNTVTSDRLKTLVPEGLNVSPNPTTKFCRKRNWVPWEQGLSDWPRDTSSSLRTTPPHAPYSVGLEHCQALTALTVPWAPRLNTDTFNQADWNLELPESHRHSIFKMSNNKVHKRLHQQRQPSWTGNWFESPQRLRCPAHPEGGILRLGKDSSTMYDVRMSPLKSNSYSTRWFQLQSLTLLRFSFVTWKMRFPLHLIFF